MNHILNGNRTKNIGLNIIQINKGNSYLEKKIDSKGEKGERLDERSKKSRKEKKLCIEI